MANRRRNQIVGAILLTIVCCSVAMNYGSLHPQLVRLTRQARPSTPVHVGDEELSIGDAVRQLRDKMDRLRHPVGDFLRRMKTQPPRVAHLESPNHALEYHDFPGTIFVTLVNEDGDCAETVNNLLGQAAEPQKVFVGIVDDAAGSCVSNIHRLCNLSEFCATDQIRHRQTVGGSLMQKERNSLEQYRGEEFYMKVRSAARFTKHWDTALKEAHALASNATSAIAVLSGHYPLQGDAVEVPCGVVGKDRKLSWQYKQVKATWPAEVSVRTSFASSDFLFSKAGVIADTPVDVAFEGPGDANDVALSLRLFMKGYDFFAPPATLLRPTSAYVHVESEKDADRVQQLATGKINDPAWTKQARTITAAITSMGLDAKLLTSIKSLC